MTDAELIARLRDLGDHAAFEPHMHHVAANRIYGLGLLRDMAEAKADALQKRLDAVKDNAEAAIIGLMAELDRCKLLHKAMQSTALDLQDKLDALLQERQDRIKDEADRIAALDEIARLGQEFDAETEAGGSIIQGLREAAEYTKGMLKEGGK